MNHCNHKPKCPKCPTCKYYMTADASCRCGINMWLCINCRFSVQMNERRIIIKNHKNYKKHFQMFPEDKSK